MAKKNANKNQIGPLGKSSYMKAHKPLMPKESKKLNVVLYHHIKKDYYFIFAYANGKEELYRNYFRKYADIFDNVAFVDEDAKLH